MRKGYIPVYNINFIINMCNLFVNCISMYNIYLISFTRKCNVFTWHCSLLYYTNFCYIVWVFITLPLCFILWGFIILRGAYESVLLYLSLYYLTCSKNRGNMIYCKTCSTLYIIDLMFKT